MIKKLKNWKIEPITKEYTPWRQTLAWLGLISLTIAIIWGIVAFFGAKRVITIINEQNTRSEANWNDRWLAYEIHANITAYTSDPAETDDTPRITASNKKVWNGIIANNCLRFGTRIIIEDTLYEVWDRMNPRYGCEHFDIWYNDKEEALEFGRQYQKVIIINNHD